MNISIIYHILALLFITMINKKIGLGLSLLYAITLVTIYNI